MASKYEEALGDVKARAEKSDLENLAHAELACDAEIARLAVLKVRIRTLAEADYRNQDEIRKVYNEATGR